MQPMEPNQHSDPVRGGGEDLDQFFTLSLEMLCVAGLDGYFRRRTPPSSARWATRWRSCNPSRSSTSSIPTIARPRWPRSPGSPPEPRRSRSRTATAARTARTSGWPGPRGRQSRQGIFGTSSACTAARSTRAPASASRSRKIAWRHNGDITATGIPGQGATFRLTLPLAPAVSAGDVEPRLIDAA